MKLAIVGSRKFDDYDKLKEFVLKNLKLEDIEIVISGGAKGADSLAEKFAEEHGIYTEIFKPQWDKFGRSAGFKRNVQIIESADTVIAFWDGISKGTLHSINLAKKGGKHIIVCKY